MPADVPTVFVHWEAFTGWVLDHTAKFPRSVRASFSTRIESLTLDVFERLIEARYSKARRPALAAANLDFEKLRLLFRLAHDRGILSHDSFVYAVEQIDVAGRQVGGWLKATKEDG